MTGIRDLERQIDALADDDRGPLTHQDLADAWRAALESNPATYDELQETYERELMGDRD